MAAHIMRIMKTKKLEWEAAAAPFLYVDERVAAGLFPSIMVL